MKTLTLSLTAAAAALLVNSSAFAGPGGREADPRQAPREHAVTVAAPVAGQANTTIGLAVNTQPEMKVEQRFNAKGQAYFLYVTDWTKQGR